MTLVLLHRHLDTKRSVFSAKMLHYSFHCLQHFHFRLNDVVMLNDDAIPYAHTHTQIKIRIHNLFQFGSFYKQLQFKIKHSHDVHLINGIYRTPNRLINYSMSVVFRQQHDRLLVTVDVLMLQENYRIFKKKINRD